MINEWKNNENWYSSGNTFEELKTVLESIDRVTTREYVNTKDLLLYHLYEGTYYTGKRQVKCSGINSPTIIEYNNHLHDITGQAVVYLAKQIGGEGSLMTYPTFCRNSLIMEGCQREAKWISLIKRQEKIFGVFSEKYTYIPQTNILNVLNEAEEIFGETKIDFIVNQDMTSVYVEFTKERDRIAASYDLSKDITPGIYVATSDTADSSFRIREYWNIGSNYIIGKEVSRKHIGAVDMEELIDSMKRKIFGEYQYVPQRLSELSEIEIDINSVDLEYIFKKYRVSEFLGKKRTKELIPQIEMELFGKKTAYDVVISLLTLGERLVGDLSQFQKEIIQERLYDILEYDFRGSRLVLT